MPRSIVSLMNLRLPTATGTGAKRGILTRYIAGEYLISFLVCFLFFFVIFLVNQFILMAKSLLEFHTPTGDVMMLLFYSMPSVVALSVPFAALVGALMAVGRMSSDDELLVMLCSGISIKRIFAPFLVLGLLLASVSFLFNDVLLPIGTVNFYKLQSKIAITTPAFVLQPYSARELRGQGITIVNGAVSGSTIEDILIFDTTDQAKRRVISASKAVLSENPDQKGVISLSLENAFTIMSDPSAPDTFEYSKADRMEYNILTSKITDAISVTPQQMSSYDVGNVIREKERAVGARKAERDEAVRRLGASLRSEYLSGSAQVLGRTAQAQDASARLAEIQARIAEQAGMDFSDRSLDMYLQEYHKKFSIPFGAFFFAFLSFPLGMYAKRSGRAVGFGLGLIIALVYWALIWICMTLSRQTDFSPAIAMWIPNAVVFLSGVALLAIRKKRGTL